MARANHTLETPLLASIRLGQTETTNYLLSLHQQIPIGLVEAAALRYRERLPRLIQEFEEQKCLDERFGLSGTEVAFIFSGLSGDMDLVLDLMKQVDHVNVGMDTPLQSVGYYAVESGNIPLVRSLVQDYGLSFDSSTSKRMHNSILFHAVRSVPMMDFLVHELKIDNFQVIDNAHSRRS